jgi:hypothetical protein
MTARAEVTGLARVGQQVILSTPIAVDARKTMVQVVAAHEGRRQYHHAQYPLAARVAADKLPTRVVHCCAL